MYALFHQFYTVGLPCLQVAATSAQYPVGDTVTIHVDWPFFGKDLTAGAEESK